MAIFNRYVSLPEGRIFHTFLYMLVFFGVPCGCFTNIFTVPARESPSQTAAQDTWTERSPRLRRCRARRARVECPNPPVRSPSHKMCIGWCMLIYVDATLQQIHIEPLITSGLFYLIFRVCVNFSGTWTANKHCFYIPVVKHGYSHN